MAQSLETPPTPGPGTRPTTTKWERDEKVRNAPRQTPVATTDSVSHGSRDEELHWKGFVATYFPGTPRHNFKVIIAYSDYKRSFRVLQEGV